MHFTLALDVSYILTFSNELTNTPDMDVTTLEVLNSDRQHRFCCIFWLRKSILTLHLNIDGVHEHLIQVPINLFRILISNPAIGILCVTIDNIFLVLTIRNPLFGFLDGIKCMWQNTLTVQSFIASLLTGLD